MTHEMLVYACGPIDGLDYDGANDWRERLTQELRAGCPSAMLLSPLRFRDQLRNFGVLDSRETNHLNGSPINTTRGAALRDEMDVRRSDIVFANFLGAKKVSIGSVAEIGIARGLHKVIIVIMEEDNLHRHFLIEEWSNYVVTTWEEGVKLLCQIVNVLE